MSDMQPNPGLVRRFLAFMAEDKWWWITPILLLVVLVGAFLIVVEGSTLAPFVYSMF